MVLLATTKKAGAARADTAVRVRRVQAADIPQVIGLDTRVTKLAKAEYWNDVFRRYGKQRLRERFFLVAESRADRANPHVLGFIIGEIRAWEFGSTPCGWVFALSVEPEMRLHKRRLRDARSDFQRVQEGRRQQDADHGGQG